MRADELELDESTVHEAFEGKARMPKGTRNDSLEGVKTDAQKDDMTSDLRDASQPWSPRTCEPVGAWSKTERKNRKWGFDSARPEFVYQPTLPKSFRIPRFLGFGG